MKTGRFRKKPTTDTSASDPPPLSMDSHSATDGKKSPNSPLRNIFKKKKRDVETFKDVEGNSSSDRDIGVYLPSTLKNFSSTKNLEGISPSDVNDNESVESSTHDIHMVSSVESENEDDLDQVADEHESAVETAVKIQEEDSVTESHLSANTDTGNPEKGIIEENTVTNHEEMQTEVTPISGEKEAINEIKSSGNSESAAPSSQGSEATIPQDEIKSKDISLSESKMSSPDKTTVSSTDKSDSDGSPSGNKKTVEGILRSSTTEVTKETTIPNTTNGDDNEQGSNNLIIKSSKKTKTSGKAVSFADENGGIISELQTIDVSPSKLSRKIRRGKALPAGYDNLDDDDESSSKSKSGVMGRVLVLLMDPPTKQYELTSIPYPLVSNEDGVVGPTMLKVILGLVATSASYEPLKIKKYKGFMRPDGTEMMVNERTILDYKFIKDEVLVAIPEGYGVEECSRFCKPILQDKRLVKLLKRLKRHEKKAEKKRRLKFGEGMKPSYYDKGRNGKLLLDGKKRPGIRIFGDGIVMSTLRLIGIICIVLLVMSILLGASKYVQDKKAQEFLLFTKTLKEDNPSCGRGSLCKSFGVKQNEKAQDKAFLAKIRDGIRNWKLESDDLML